ncbi:MAG TPA: DUF6538 domain-containing protein [Novosphingobium sp.]|nr:DUF6538 domain-containing protein [Novosphingobium sp.]
MTGARRIARSTTPHLHRRNGIFHLRVRVPDVVRLKLGMCEVHRSLKTYNQVRARLLAAVLVPQVHEVFKMAATTTMDRLQLTALIRSNFEDLASEVDGGYLPRTDRENLFSAPLFRGCASPKRRFVAGKLKFKDDYFWIPMPPSRHVRSVGARPVDSSPWLILATYGGGSSGIEWTCAMV